MALTASIRDNFNDNTRNTSIWNQFGSVSETGGKLVVTSTISSAVYGGYTSVNTYDLTGSYAYARVVDAGNQSLTSWQATPILLALDASNNLSWYVNAGNIHAQNQVAGVYTDIKGDVAYDSAVHKYFRIRESSGTIYWDYSTNGKAWTNYTSTANPFAITALEVDIIAGTYSPELSQTSATFDNFNLVPGGKLTLLGVG